MGEVRGDSSGGCRGLCNRVGVVARIGLGFLFSGCVDIERFVSCLGLSDMTEKSGVVCKI